LGLISLAVYPEAEVAPSGRGKDSGKQPVEILAGLLGHEIGNQLVGEAVCQFAKELSQILLGRGWPSIWLMPQECNGLLFTAKLAFVADQAFLVNVA
jgi:hypothetical protein